MTTPFHVFPAPRLLRLAPADWSRPVMLLAPVTWPAPMVSTLKRSNVWPAPKFHTWAPPSSVLWLPIETVTVTPRRFSRRFAVAAGAITATACAAAAAVALLLQH